MNQLSKFTNLYSLSKTLRFELRPQGRTLEYIETKGLIDEDRYRAESYTKVKKIIDAYHRHFIQQALSNFTLKTNQLLAWKEEKNTDKKDKLQDSMRTEIVNCLTGHDAYKTIYKKELFKSKERVLLVEFIKGLKYEEIDSLPVESKEAAIDLLGEFKDFTTYFTGFHKNRKNMYSKEAQGTAIANRIINENLPRYLDNKAAFDRKIANSELNSQFVKLEQQFKLQLKVLARLSTLHHINGVVAPLTIPELFQLEHFSRVITQEGIDAYNTILGGYSLEDKQKIQGLNEIINLFNQQQTEKSKRLPKLKVLYKQILSNSNSSSFQLDLITEDSELLNALHDYHNELNLVLYQTDNNPTSLSQLMAGIGSFELDKIYLKNDSLTDISRRVFGSWSLLKEAIEQRYEDEKPFKPTKTNTREKYENRRNKILNKNKSYSIAYLNELVTNISESNADKLSNYFVLLRQNEVNLIEEIEQRFNQIREMVSTEHKFDKKLNQDSEQIENIKNYLDAVKGLQQFIKPLLGNKDETEKDGRFYSELDPIWNTLDKVIPLYNKARNYLTRKRYSTKKIKLNFGNSTLLDGWDRNKEQKNIAVLLMKDGNYYLALMDIKYNNLFVCTFDNVINGYQKVDYKLLPGPNKMLPHVFFSKKGVETFSPPQHILDRYKQDTHKKGNKFNLQHCHDLIDYFKQEIEQHPDWKHFNFKFSDTSSYADIGSFYREVEHQGYKVTYSSIPDAYINDAVEQGQLYLFQIYNKDFSPYSKGTPNLHTLYWKALFEEQNLADVVYKLNGKAEVFYREKSIDSNENVIHKAYRPLKNKNPNNPKKESRFEFDIEKDRRFTLDKFQFHASVTINFRHQGIECINERANHYLTTSDNLHVIGIDRGERHLLYITVIDLDGNIKMQKSLNEIINKHHNIEHKINYHNILDTREQKRDQARKSWKSIESIKELKEGYLSQVVHEISKLILEFNAIVVLEDLNFGFMRGRQKVEKQVYLKFEKMLIDKLNYLIDKQATPNQPSGLYHALQLTNKFKSFEKLGKQSGFLFYIPAWNTSKMDPTTGFVNLMDTRYKNKEQSQKFFNKFSRIRYNLDNDYFEFHIENYNVFNPKAEGTRQNWVICTYGKRIKTERDPAQNNQWVSQEVDITHEWKQLFAQNQIDIHSNLCEAFARQTEASFYKSAMYLIKLTLQLRNSETGTAIDYMQSPVKNTQRVFFNSNQATKSQPQDADANGAYNIARKGLMVVEQIRQAKINGENLGKMKFDISNQSWLKFAQGQIEQ